MSARVVLALAAVLLAASASAQPGPGPAPVPHAPGPRPPDLGRWWKDSQVVSRLGITPAQSRRIEEAFFEHRLKLIDLRADLEREEARLQPLVEADQPDEARVGAQIDAVAAARGRLEKANALMMLAIRRVLTVEQWRKLEALRQEREMAPRPGPPPHRPDPGPPPRPRGDRPGDEPRGPGERPGRAPRPPDDAPLP